MAPAQLTLKELDKQYTEFLKFQNEVAQNIEECMKDDEELDEVCPRAYITRRFVSSIGDTYTVQYCVHSDDKDSTVLIMEEAVSRERIMYYDYHHMDQSLADKLCPLMMHVPEPGEIFDPKYFKYHATKVDVRNYPFPEDDNAPSLGCCGGCCGPHRKYIKYTMKEKKGSNTKPPLYLYEEYDGVN